MVEFFNIDRSFDLHVTAPPRIDIGGGITDLPEFSKVVGTKIFNIAIDVYEDVRCKNALKIEVTTTPNNRDEPRLFVNNTPIHLESESANFNLPREVFLRLLASSNKIPSLDVKISNPFPDKTGLGCSAVITLCLARALLHERGGGERTYTVTRAHNLETKKLGIRGGFQDYIAAYFGGYNYIDFPSLSETLIESKTLGLKAPRSIEDDLNKSMVIVVRKQGSRSSSEILDDQANSLLTNRKKTIELLNGMQSHNEKIFKKFFQKGSSLKEIGAHVNDSWKLQKQLQAFSQPGVLKDIEKSVQSSVYGLRGLGSGNNSLLLLIKPGSKKDVLRYLQSLNDSALLLYGKVNSVGLQAES